MVFLRFFISNVIPKTNTKVRHECLTNSEVWELKFRRKMKKWKKCLKITICMNVSHFMNLAAIFSFDLQSQSRVFGAECIGHVFNLAERGNTSSTIRKHPWKSLVCASTGTCPAFYLKNFSCDFLSGSSKICFKKQCFDYLSAL